MSFVEINSIAKHYGDNIVLDGIDLAIEKGEVIAVIGPSGTGKSTLLRCLNLLEKPDYGEIMIDDKTFSLINSQKKETVELRQYTEMVFQQFHLFTQKNALENVMEGLITVKKYKKEEAKKIACRQLENVGMLEKAYHYPKHLSGGQQQRVAIARALAMEPKLLLMDEPTSALDPELVVEVLNTIKKIAQEGYTILLVTHEMNFVKQIASRVIFLEEGVIVEEGTPKKIFENPSSQRLKDFLVQINVLSNIDYNI